MKDLDSNTDGQLLAAFANDGDQTTFATLVGRHGAMVHGVCSRVLGDRDEARDVAQAVFLTLASQAASLRKDASVGGWLHVVASRLALNARRDRICRLRHEEAAMKEREAAEAAPVDTERFREGLDAAISALPEKYRQPLVLFHLEENSLQQTAARLGLNPFTTGTRLARGREMLRKKLIRRGVTIGSAALVAGLSQSTASAAELPAALVASTCQAATAVAAGGTVAGGGLISAKVAALTNSALKMLFWGQVKTVAGVAAAALIATNGAGYVWQTVHDDQASREARVTASPTHEQTVDKSGDEKAGTNDWLQPLPSNEELAATTLEDGEIIFQDDFTNGLANWEVLRLNPATKQFEPLPEAMKDCIKIVSMKRGDKEIKAVRVDAGNEVVVLALRQPIRERWFAVEFEDHFSDSAANGIWLMCGIFGTSGSEQLVPFQNRKRTFSHEEQQTQWWRLRWEYCCGTDPQGRPSVDNLRQVGAVESRGRTRDFLENGIVRPYIGPGTFLISRVAIRRLVPKERAVGVP
jgi:RNA polymerase sigma factor (sigma-70 family)